MSSTRAPVAAAPARLGVVRYMGNKLALLPAITAAVEELAPKGSLVVDPMAGSHAVTYALKSRHRIACSDVQEYSTVIGRAFVEDARGGRLAAADLERLLDAGRQLERGEGVGFLEQTYADTYLGARQCRQLDALRAAVERCFPDDEPRRWLTLTALLTAACRAQSSPGHFAQFLPPQHPRTLPLRRIDLFDVVATALTEWEVLPGRAGSRALRHPWRSLVERDGDLLADARLWYVDPPYTRDHYSRFYHFLETLSLGDRPDVRHKARYRTDRFRSAFCSPVTAARELEDLLAAVRRVSPRAVVLLSYSSRGLLSDEDLRRIAGRGFAIARFERLPHAYSTQGKGRLDGVEEWLLSLTPR